MFFVFLVLSDPYEGVMLRAYFQHLFVVELGHVFQTVQIRRLNIHRNSLFLQKLG